MAPTQQTRGNNKPGRRPRTGDRSHHEIIRGTAAAAGCRLRRQLHHIPARAYLKKHYSCFYACPRCKACKSPCRATARIAPEPRNEKKKHTQSIDRQIDRAKMASSWNRPRLSPLVLQSRSKARLSRRALHSQTSCEPSPVLSAAASALIQPKTSINRKETKRRRDSGTV